MAAFLEAGQHPAHIIGPGRICPGDRGSKRDVREGLQLGAEHPPARARRGRGGRHQVAIDGHRQHEAAVVVGVLADQVHPARRGHQQAGRPAEPVGETLARDLGQGREIGGRCAGSNHSGPGDGLTAGPSRGSITLNTAPWPG